MQQVHPFYHRVRINRAETSRHTLLTLLPNHKDKSSTFHPKPHFSQDLNHYPISALTMPIIIIKNIITNIIGAIVFQKMYPGVLVRSSIGGTSPILIFHLTFHPSKKRKLAYATGTPSLAALSNNAFFAFMKSRNSKLSLLTNSKSWFLL